MKNSILVISGILIVALIMMLFLTRDKDSISHVSSTKPIQEHPSNRDKEKPKSIQRKTTVKNLSIEQHLERVVRCSVVAWNDEDKQWVKLHDSGITICQKGEFLRGFLTKGKKTIDLGETPPRYLLQLDTVGNPVVFGSMTNRKQIIRSISQVIETEEGIRIQSDFQISIPRAGNPSHYGFVFDRNEDHISKIGVILPILNKPPAGESTQPYEINVRYNGKPYATYNRDDVESSPQMDIKRSHIVLLGVEEMKEKRVHVLWLEVKQEGGIEIVNE